MGRVLLTALSLLFITTAAAREHFTAAREEMVRTIQALAKAVPVPGLSAARSIHPCWTPCGTFLAMSSCLRNVRHAAYKDRPLPIGHGQTISQPYIVALMTSLAMPAKNHAGARSRNRLRLSGSGALAPRCAGLLYRAYRAARPQRSGAPQGSWVRQCHRPPRGWIQGLG